jgi:hypothetical protein
VAKDSKKSFQAVKVNLMMALCIYDVTVTIRLVSAHADICKHAKNCSMKTPSGTLQPPLAGSNVDTLVQWI